MTIPPINEKIIRQNSTNASYQRGQYYYDSGAVISLWQRGQNLQALVSGSEVKPYRVAIDFNQENLENVSCSCPYDYEGWCKHIVAVLLTCSRQPELIIKKASLEELLTPIDESKLRKLLKYPFFPWYKLNPSFFLITETSLTTHLSPVSCLANSRSHSH